MTSFESKLLATFFGGDWTVVTRKTWWSLRCFLKFWPAVSNEIWAGLIKLKKWQLQKTNKIAITQLRQMPHIWWEPLLKVNLFTFRLGRIIMNDKMKKSVWLDFLANSDYVENFWKNGHSFFWNQHNFDCLVRRSNLVLLGQKLHSIIREFCSCHFGASIFKSLIDWNWGFDVIWSNSRNGSRILILNYLAVKQKTKTFKKKWVVQLVQDGKILFIPPRFQILN